MTTIRIANWDDNFENNRTRKMIQMQWIPLPNKFDGDGYTELMDMENGLAYFGIWVLLAEAASKCHPRGTLVRDNGKPHDSASLSRMTRAPKEMFDQAIPIIADIGWIELLSCENIEETDPSALIAHPARTLGAPIAHGVDEEGKGREWKGKKGMELGAGGTAQEGASSGFNDSDIQRLGILDEESVKLCFALALVFCDSILSWNPSIPALQEGIRRDTWIKYAAESIWQLLDTDKRPEQLIRDVLEYLPKHERKKTGEAPFKWRNSTLTGRKLFDNFEQIRIAMVEDKESDSGYEFEARP